jgi:hypothetical protein
MPRWRNAAPPQNGLQVSGAGSVTIVVPQGRSRAPASDSRFMRQGSLVPAAAGCWGHDGCRQGLERHDRLHSLPKATLCSSTGRYAVSGAKGTPVTVEGEAGTAAMSRACQSGQKTVQRSARLRPVPGLRAAALGIWIASVIVSTGAPIRALLGGSPTCRVRRYPSGVLGARIGCATGEFGVDRADGAANSRRSSEAGSITAGQGMFGRYL